LAVEEQKKTEDVLEKRKKQKEIFDQYISKLTEAELNELFNEHGV